MAGLVARVAVSSPVPALDRLFDYAVPDGLAAEVRPGVRVTVPLRSAGRLADGFVVDLRAAEEPAAAASGAAPTSFSGPLSAIESVVSSAPVLSPEIWNLARRVADRQAASASDVLRLAVPPRAVRVEKAWLAAKDARAAHPARETQQQRPFATAGDAIDARLSSALDANARLALSAVPELVEVPSADADARWVGEWALTLARAAAHVVAGGRSAIVATADYRDEEQLLAALDAVGAHDSIAVLDARRPAAQRYAAFLSCLDESPRVIVGNRSVVYAPAARLGLIALFDDGDPLFAEPLAPYAHARDVALIRQEQQGGALIFAGLTRSVEVQRLVELRWLDELQPVRSRHPHVISTAFQAGDAIAAATRIPSSAWQAARDAVAAGPVLVQVASPGYVRVVACARCRQAARCGVCAGPLGVAAAGAHPACAWCGAINSDWHCSNCDATTLRIVTQGSGRTADELGRAFPGVRVIVSDGERPLTRIGRDPALVVATRGAEPVAEGGYAAVLLLDGERMLQRESLRVADDCLRWWSNAAALATPGAPVFLVGVGGAIAQALTLWRQPSWAAAQLSDRRELGFPPAVRVASVTGSPRAVEKALGALDGVAVRDILGPTPIASDARPAAIGAADASVRAVVRFDYAHGAEVAAALRSAIVSGVAGTRRPPTGPAGERKRRAAPALKVKFDDPDFG